MNSQKELLTESALSEEIVMNESIFHRPPGIRDHARFCDCKFCKKYYEEDIQ